MNCHGPTFLSSALAPARGTASALEAAFGKLLVIQSSRTAVSAPLVSDSAPTCTDCGLAAAVAADTWGRNAGSFDGPAESLSESEPARIECFCEHQDQTVSL